MKFDPQTVEQAEAFVNALRAGKRAHMPALRFGQWQQFMTTVYAGLGLAQQETAACGRPVRRNHVTTEF